MYELPLERRIPPPQFGPDIDLIVGDGKGGGEKREMGRVKLYIIYMGGGEGQRNNRRYLDVY